jgi:predicted dehydrogenase
MSNNPTQDSIKIGIIGAGDNTRRQHLPELRKIEGVEVVCVANRSLGSSRAVCDEFEIPRAYDDWREVIEDDEVDAVVIGTWPYLHARATVAALEAGKHVLCEARMAMNLNEARGMLETAQANPDLVTQLVPAPMTLRVDATIIRKISQGYLGEILAVEIRGGGGFIDRQSTLTWRQNMDYSGLNTLAMGIFYETLMRWIGHARGVTAVGRVFVKTRPDHEGIARAVRVPDHLNIIAEMACGAQAAMTFSAVTGHAGPVEITLYGSDATLKYTQDRLYGGRRGEDGLQEIEIPRDEQAGWRVEREFIGAIRGEEDIRLTTFTDGYKYMEFTEAVTLSMQSGQTVPLPIL